MVKTVGGNQKRKPLSGLLPCMCMRLYFLVRIRGTSLRCEYNAWMRTGAAGVQTTTTFVSIRELPVVCVCES